MMLLAMAIGSPLAVAAMLTYVIAHALIKSSLFFTSGIILHRLRSISERFLFRKGRSLPFTAALWFLGGAGLAAAPGFATMLAEAGVARAEELAHLHGISLLFMIGGALTGGAVFRVGMHTFPGWGSEPLTDESAEIGELPETGEADHRIYWYHIAPPTLLLAMAIALPFLPRWLPLLSNAAVTLSPQAISQAAYLHTVYTGQTVDLTQPTWYQALPAATLRGTMVLALAWLLACSSVFRLRIKRWLRVGPRLEGDQRLLRALQSGHPGDYVLYLTGGLAVFGSAAMLLLRS
jgi:NADH:ubiquinone oxidoreductase subunit 5 (subunit L)/multisubunit Na+/H+ antiporter MnhA subunit